MTDDPSDLQETTYVNTATYAKMVGVHPRTIRKRIEAGRLEAHTIGGAYMIPVTAEALAAAGLDPDQVTERSGVDGEPSPDVAVAIRNTPQLPALPEPVDLEPLAATIRELATRNAELAAEAAAAEGRALSAQGRALAAQERAETAERELEATRSALVVRDPRPWWKRFLAIE